MKIRNCRYCTIAQCRLHAIIKITDVSSPTSSNNEENGSICYSVYVHSSQSCPSCTHQTMMIIGAHYATLFDAGEPSPSFPHTGYVRLCSVMIVCFLSYVLGCDDDVSFFLSFRHMAHVYPLRPCFAIRLLDSPQSQMCGPACPSSSPCWFRQCSIWRARARLELSVVRPLAQP
jgi:hypothetical protein